MSAPCMLFPATEMPVHCYVAPRRSPLLRRPTRTVASKAHPTHRGSYLPHTSSATSHMHDRAQLSLTDCLLTTRLLFETLRWPHQKPAFAHKRDRGASARRRSLDPSRWSCGIDRWLHRTDLRSRVSLP